MVFANREDAGRRLASLLLHLRGEEALVLGLPRGGVVVAHEVAEQLDAPLDVWAVRKIGAPEQPELGLGAVAEGGSALLDPELVRAVAATDEQVAAAIARETIELDRRVRAYRRGRPPPSIRGRLVILVDDGLATGGSARAALRALRSQRPARLVLAVPVASAEALTALAEEADEVVCAKPVAALRAIGAWYADFEQTTDAEVVALLDHAAASRLAFAASGARAVAIRTAGVTLAADLAVPRGSVGLVLFAHGSGSGRGSERNRKVAADLRRGGLATLLVDLLTPDEQSAGASASAFGCDLGQLGARFAGVTDWVRAEPSTQALALGYFGGSTGAAVALLAAVARREVVRAVVSRGGRPDLAVPYLERVEAPTLLIVGALDEDVLRVNRAALHHLGGPAQLALVPGAGHLFEAPGALAEVAHLAEDWLHRYLVERPVDQARLKAG